MDFKFKKFNLELIRYQPEPVEDLITALNRHFKGWVLIENKIYGDCFALNVIKYERTSSSNLGVSGLYSESTAQLPKDKKEFYNINISVESQNNSCPLGYYDIIHKLEVINVEMNEPKIKWWKKGKFETTFEHNNIDPYGEEDWNEGDKIYDISNDDIDTQIETLKKLILAQEYAIHFFYTEMFIDNDKNTKWQVWNKLLDEPGDTTWDINNIIQDEDGNILFEGSIMEYKEENWYDYPVFFTLDTAHPIKFTNSDIEIRL